MTAKQRLTAVKNKLILYLSNINTSLVAKGASAVSDIGDVSGAIDTISTGVTPTGTISITQNGNYDVTDFASASVAVQKHSIFTYTGNKLSNAQLVNSFVRTLLPTKGSVTLVNCKETISDFSQNELHTFTTSNILNGSSATRVRNGYVQTVAVIDNAYDLVLETGMQFYLQNIEFEGAEE